MGTQLHSYGNLAKTLLMQGQQTSRCNLPVGYYFDDGSSRYRWSFIQLTTHIAGQYVVQPNATSGLKLTSSMFKSCQTKGGNTSGDTEIALYSAVTLSATIISNYIGGRLFVVSGKGRGQCYTVKKLETGAAGKITKMTIDGGIRLQGLSTRTRAQLKPPAYYGLKLATAHLLCAIPGGFLTASGTTSGWQFVQTRGFGVGFCGDTVGLGQALVAANISGKVSAMSAKSACVPIAIAETAGTAGGFMGIQVMVE